MFFHGAGTVDGFDFAEPWTDKFRVIVPYPSGLRRIRRRSDLHRPARLRHALSRAVRRCSALDSSTWSGFSLGGYLAAKFAIEHGHRVKKLVLIAPAGLRDNNASDRRRAGLPRRQIPGLLVSNFDVIKTYLPEKPDLDFIGDRYREGGTVARLLWEHPDDPKCHALSAPPQDADADRLGRRGQDYPGRSRPRPGAASFPTPTSRSSRARATSCSTRSAKPSMQCSDSCPDITASLACRFVGAVTRVRWYHAGDRRIVGFQLVAQCSESSPAFVIGGPSTGC